MDILVTGWGLLSFVVFGMQWRERKRDEMTPLTHNVTWGWIAGLVILLAVWKMG